eukprot:5868376-Amphidinium_carterae.1
MAVARLPWPAHLRRVAVHCKVEAYFEAWLPVAYCASREECSRGRFFFAQRQQVALAKLHASVAELKRQVLASGPWRQ